MKALISHWVALSFVQGIGNVHIKNLLERFGTPDKIFGASWKELAEVEGIGEKSARAIAGFSHWKDVDREILKAQKTGARLLTLTDPDYPNLLKEIYDPPPVLYARGEIKAGNCRAIAVVGSRQPTDYGRVVAERMAEGLAQYGVIVVSGMARGIDSIAHRACLKAGGQTIAVLGSGLDIIYPPEHKRLYEEIAGHGAVVSEFSFGTPPLAENFPRRNRIISGMSAGVLVVEATLRSGSLITARLALDQGREVFAVPGNVLSPKSAGTNNLIKQGAKPVDRVEEILEEIIPQMKEVQSFQRQPSLSGGEKKLYDFLGPEPKDIDSIIVGCGFEGAEASSILTRLELSGLVIQLPGKRFART